MTHSFSVHQQLGGLHQVSRKAKATAGKGFWEPECIAFINERGTSRTGRHSGVIATSENAETGTIQQFYCLMAEE